MELKSVILSLLLLSTHHGPMGAAPAYPLEGLLEGAEIVYVGRVSELSLERRPRTSYCGWLMYPLSNAGGDGVIASLHSSKLGNKAPLTLNRVKEAVGETRYDPDLYRKRRR